MNLLLVLQQYMFFEQLLILIGVHSLLEVPEVNTIKIVYF
jgi:hypothetical protein